jgi:hypothetical protein
MDEAQQTKAQCPTCGHRARLVDTQTVKAMLAISLYAIRPLRYYFCATADCSTVYFAEDGAQRFGEEDLRVPVYQKRAQDDHVPICYCFDHTQQSIRDEWQQTGESTAVETITIGTQTGQCACDIRNPQGTCCLGNVRRFVRQMAQSAR